MKKEVKKRVGGPSLGGSSFFNVNFRSEGMFWVGLYEEIEKSCNVYADACSQYVNTAGEHFKRICDEVHEWENSSGLDEQSGSYLPLKQDAVSEVLTKSSAELDKDITNEQSASCDKVQATVSISVHPALAMSSSEPHILRNKDICNKDEVTGVSKRDECFRDETLQNDVDLSLQATVSISAHPVLAMSSSGPCIVREIDACNKDEAAGVSKGDEHVTVELFQTDMDLSLKHDAARHEVSLKSSTEDFSNENVSVYEKFLPTGSSSQDLHGVIFFNEPQDFSSRDNNDEEESHSTEGTTCVHDTGEGCMKLPDNICLANCSSSFSRDYILVSASNQEGGSSINSGSYAYKHAISFLCSPGTQHDLGKSEAFVQFSEIGKPLSVISDRLEHNISCSPDGYNANIETEMFEDILLEDRWDDLDMNEIAIISERKSNNISYKKKLSKFISKVRYGKGYNQVDDKYDIVNDGPSTLKCPEKLSSQDSVEPGWELL